MQYRSLAERPDTQARAHIVRSGLDGDFPGELRETAERGNHLLAIMPAGTAPLRLHAQLGSIGCDRIAILALSLSGAVLANARFNLERIETIAATDCDAECRSREDGIEIDVAFAAAAQPRFVAIALLHDGALTYDGDPARGIIIRTIAIAGEEIDAPAEPVPAPTPAATPPFVAPQPTPERRFEALSHWLDLTRGELGHSYAWRSGQQRHGAMILVREALAVKLRIESVAAIDGGIELRAPVVSAGIAVVVAALTRQLERSIDALDDDDTRAMARSTIADLHGFLAPLFTESAEEMLMAG